LQHIQATIKYYFAIRASISYSNRNIYFDNRYCGYDNRTNYCLDGAFGASGPCVTRTDGRQRSKARTAQAEDRTRASRASIRWRERATLLGDEVQGDQEGRLHGDDGDADGNRMAPRHAGQFYDASL
jgi:hypothetical protein